MKLPAVSIVVSVLTDGLTRRLKIKRPKGRGINLITIKNNDQNSQFKQSVPHR